MSKHALLNVHSLYTSSCNSKAKCSQVFRNSSSEIVNVMKRAVAGAAAAAAIHHAAPPDTDQFSEALRSFIISSYSVLRSVDGAFVAELCWHITRAEGKGVEDLAIHPSTASKHGGRLVKHILARDYEDPDLVNVVAPAWNKKSCEREKGKIPIHLPSAIFSKEFAGDHVSLEREEPQDLQDKYACKAWLEHPLKVNNTGHWSRLVPCSLYWDAAQYSIRDNFFGLFMRNLRSGLQELLFIVRFKLICLKS